MTTNSKKTVLQGEVSINIIKNKDDFLAECRDLDLFTWGATAQEAIDELREVISLFLQEITAHNKHAEVLSSLGWQIRENKYEIALVPPFIIKTEKLKLNEKYA